MGCRATKDGISIQFVNQDGSPDGAPIHGRFAKLSGGKRDDVVGAGGLTPDETAFPGSEHWLTLIAVADTAKKLEAMVGGIKMTNPDTSCSSRRAAVEVHIGEMRQSFRDRITIASGPFTKDEQGAVRVDVVHVKVLPAGIVLSDLEAKDKNHPLVLEYRGSAFALNTLFQ
jgi:hypothetical protein